MRYKSNFYFPCFRCKHVNIYICIHSTHLALQPPQHPAHTAAVPFQGFQFDGAMAWCGADEGAKNRKSRGAKQPKNTKDRCL